MSDVVAPETSEPPSPADPLSLASQATSALSDAPIPRRISPASIRTHGFRRRFFPEATAADWRDWRWQSRNRIRNLAGLERVFELTADERRAVVARGGALPVGITPYYASLMSREDPMEPLRRTHIPVGDELVRLPGEDDDPLGEDHDSPVPGLVHRYPDRVLFLTTGFCATYCRYCTRSRIVGDPAQTFSSSEFEMQIEYIKRTPQIRDVLLSGGDPLVLAPKILERILSALRAIPHVEIVRIGSRVPVFMPQRITDELCDMLQKYHPLWLNIHVNSPNEISAELEAACDKLTRAGIPLGNQAVLLRGINDNVHLQRKLVQDLVRIRVRPYYLYQCDLVEGAGHLRTPVAKGIEIMEGLRGHTSGYAVHQYMIDAPGGGGKIPVMPNYVLSMSDHKIILRNFEGYITTYEEPTDYLPSDSATFKERRPEPGQEGLTGLLDGKQMFIKPEGFDQLHERGGIQHRLKDGSKWEPLGIGTGDE